MGNLMSRRSRGGRGAGTRTELLGEGTGGRGSQAEPLHTTETVRNDLNLRKKTLRAVPDPNRPGFFLISFVFDANVPCTVGVFFLARELEGSAADGELRLGLESKLQYKPRLAQRSAGLNQAFDQRPEDAIDTNANKDYLEYNPQSKFFPIVIRIEAAAPAATARGHTPCRNSQCTFVALERTQEGTYRTKILKQKLLVNGAEIETQEIYGIDPSSDPECVICMTAPKDTACLPCRHMCMCSSCAKIHNMHADTCPICRTRVESLLRIADPAGGDAAPPADPLTGTRAAAGASAQSGVGAGGLGAADGGAGGGFSTATASAHS